MTAPPRVVTLLTQDNCTMCDQAKDVVRRVALDQPVSLVEVPLDSPHGREMAAAAGVLFAPGILLDGAPFGHGRLSEKKLLKALAR